ncbi:MAG: multidrug efflux pump, partial [Candidatus Azotimanducaceae bacterium]
MEKPTKKNFKLTNLALANSTSVFILLFMILFLGLSSYMQMPKELFPEIKIPTIYVSTPYPGNSPEDIENLVTRPLEQEIQSIKGIKNLKSTSIQDYSAVIVEFNTDVEVSEVLQEVKDAVDKAKGDLPTDLPTDPNVSEIDFSAMPILNINLSGDFSIDNLKGYAEMLQDKIETISQINKVELKGTLEKEVKINVDLFKMEQSQISFRDIESAVANENLSMAGGEVTMEGSRRSIRIKGEFDEAEDMQDIIVKHEKGNIVYLRDIAAVVDGYKDANSYARLDGFPVVSLDVIKKSGENLLEATDQINVILAEAKLNTLPQNLKITITNDQSEQTRAQVKNLENSIISGVILVVVVLLFFLGLRNALFVGLAIPMSMFLSFLVLSAMGVSINMVVLFGLILALGMLVDNGIVVIENIYRLYEEEGLTVMEACKQGVGEVAVPIIASTATTLAAFFPLLFWNDLMGEFMKYIPMTLIIVLTSSLVVALVINPVVALTFLKPQSEKKMDKRKLLMMLIIFAVLAAVFHAITWVSLGNVMIIVFFLTLMNVFLFKPGAKYFQSVTLVKLENGYLKVLKSVMKGFRPVYYVIGMLILLIASFIIFGMSKPTVEFFPVNEPKYVNIFVESPVGSDILYTDSLTQIIEKRLENILEEDAAIVKSVVSNVGAGTSDPSEGPSMGDTPNKARIQISFVEYEHRGGASTSAVLAKISRDLGNIPGVKISAEKNNEGPPVGKPINLEIAGENLQMLLGLSEQIQLRVAESGIEGIEGLKMDMELGKPELTLDID